MSVARPLQLAIGGLAAGLLISGTVAASVMGGPGQRASTGAGRASAVHSFAGVVAPGEGAGHDGGSAAATASFGVASPGHGSGAQVAVGGRAGAATGASFRGTGALDRPGPGSPQGGASVATGGSGSFKPGAPPLGIGGTGGGGGNGGNGNGSGSSPGDGGNGGGSGPGMPGLPAAPALAAPESLHSQGSLTVVVPSTDGTSKKLCLSGEVDRCQRITVPATPGTTLKLSYSGNASAKAPTFAPVSCAGGRGVTVSGVTPGTTVTVEVGSVRLSATVGTRALSQTATLCDA